MHEYSITQSLLNLVEKECRDRSLENPLIIVARLGVLSSYKTDSIQFFFDILKEDLPRFANTRLEILEEKGKLHCEKCGQDSEIEDPSLLRCALCASPEIRLTAGMDFYIDKLIFDDQKE